MWWTGTAILLGLAYMGRSPPLMTVRKALFGLSSLLVDSATLCVCRSS